MEISGILSCKQTRLITCVPNTRLIENRPHAVSYFDVLRQVFNNLIIERTEREVQGND